MKIGIDAGPLLGGGGISRYVAPLVRSLIAGDDGTDYHLILRRSWLKHQEAAALDGLAPVTRIHVPDRVLSLWWDRLGWTLPVQRTLWRSIEVFLATCSMAPVLPRGRVVSIVYDLIPLKFPELFPSHAAFRVQLKRLLRRSAAIVAISHRTKEDLVDMMGADPALVRVIYPGRDSTFQPVPSSRAAEVAKRYGLVGPYVLYVGAMGPHKNVPALLRAYQRARLDGRLAAKLLVVGGQRWGREAIDLAHSLRVRDDIVFAGEIPREDLPSVYSGATVFVFPSRYEGFGLPVLEAMACGTPVITSNQGALPEVVGAAGHCVAPDDEVSLADAMCRVASDPALRARMAAAGRERAATFSWTHSAGQLRTLLHEVGGRNGQDG